LDVYGLRASLHGDWPEVTGQLLLDFAWFRSEDTGAPDVEVEVQRRAPDFGAFGALEASFVTPRNVVYEAGPLTVVDYFGRALSVLDRARGRLTIQGEDEHLVHEAGYLFLLSRIGEHLDRIGLPRLHALGLATPNGAAAIMLPSGGGKSTLALRTLEAGGVRLLSEDSPLMDRHGRLHPFPLRIGVNETDAQRLPADKLRRLERMEFHPKVALEVEAFADRIEREPQPLRNLVIGRRSLGTEARLDPLPRRAAAGTLLREAVVGVGLYQGMEFVLQRGAVDTVRQARPAAVRAACCAAVLRGANVWRLTLGRDHDSNWRALAPLLGA
jgi:hypothetical protein